MRAVNAGAGVTGRHARFSRSAIAQIVREVVSGGAIDARVQPDYPSTRAPALGAAAVSGVARGGGSPSIRRQAVFS
jgi:hypothetical protein